MAESKSRCHCSVPLCRSNKQRQPYLSFHGFPSEATLRRKWIEAIRREEGPTFKIRQGSTYVCSRHFSEADYTSASVSKILLAHVSHKRLNGGSVPSRFHWNNWGRPGPEPPAERPLPVEAPRQTAAWVALMEHDYCGVPPPEDGLDAAHAHTQQMEDRIKLPPKTHPSFVLRGESLQPTVLPFPHIGCPLCPRFRTQKDSAIQRHLDTHCFNAVKCRDVLICRCNQACKAIGHYHCPFCLKVLQRKKEMEAHISPCRQRWDATLPSLLRQTGGFVGPPVHEEHSYSLPPADAAVAPAHAAAPAAPRQASRLPDSLVKCRRCPAVLHKKKLLSHILRKHTPNRASMPASQLRVMRRARAAVATPPTRPHDVQQVKEEAPWTSSLEQRIKEEPAGVQISQQGEQVPHGVKKEEKEEEEEEEISGASVLRVIVKEEEEESEVEEASQFNPISSWAERLQAGSDVSDCGGGTTDARESDFAETEVSIDEEEDEDEWQEPLSDFEGRPGSRSPGALRDQGVLKRRKLFSCYVCGHQLTQLARMKAHVMMHAREKLFACSFCGEKFAMQGELRRHSRVHNWEMPYGCPICGRGFSNQCNLRRHGRVHTGEKPYGCSTCGKRFTQRGDMRRHTMLHTGEQPFSCHVCPKRFIRKTDMKSHMRVHQK